GTLVIADDYSDPDGVGVLSFGQAQDLVKAMKRPQAGSAGPLTVKQAVELYLEAKEADGRDIVDARCRAVAHIYPTLGARQCADLTSEQIRKWHRALAKSPPRARTKPGGAQRYRNFDGDDPEAVRRRQATANRVLTVLKAALNHAFNDS